jgi:hypothetical protein
MSKSKISYSLYDNPEKFDLQIIHKVAGENSSWEFDEFVIWKHAKTKKLYYQYSCTDSAGYPFDEVNSIDDLLEVSEHTLERFSQFMVESGFSVLDQILARRVVKDNLK